MRDNIPSAGRGNKILPAILIAANLLMLVIGVLTIPPNLRSAAVKESPAPRTEQTAPATPSQEEQTPPAATESGSIPAPEVTGVSLSTEERPDLEDFLWYTEDVAYDGVPSDANIIDNIVPLTGVYDRRRDQAPFRTEKRHVLNGIEAEVEQDIFTEYVYDPSAGLLTYYDGFYAHEELRPNADWTVLSGEETRHTSNN